MADEDKPSILDSVRAVADEMEGGGGDGEPRERVGENQEVGERRSGEQGLPAPPSQSAADRARDEAGRFAKADGEKKPRETLSLKKSPETAEKPADVSAPAAPPAAAGSPGAPDPLAPPAEWKGAGKVQWGKLPAPVQAQIHEDYKALAAAREQFAPLEQAIAPHRDVLTRDAGSVESGINQLMQFYNLFLTNPVGLIQHIAATRGINLGQPAGQPEQGTPQAPDLAKLIEQTVQSRIAPIEAHFRQTETSQLQSTIDAFSADKSHPYFQDVKVHMGTLLQAGTAKDMQEAYDQATWANPVIRQQLLEAQAESTKQTQAAAVAKARAASAVNLNGSPLAGVVAGGRTKGESVLDSVRRSVAEAEGA